MQGYWKTMLAVIVAGCAIPAADAQPVAQRPAVGAGDAWEFKGTSMPGDKPSDWSRTVIEAAPDVVKARSESGTLIEYDGMLNFMPQGRADFARILVKYPLKVGDEWEFSRKFPNPGTLETGKAKVVAYEAISVPAGTFQCYRIEAGASLVNKSYRENRTWKRWYCPDVKWIAKEIMETTIAGSFSRANETTVLTSELVKFTPGK